AGAGAAAAAA
nr:Chain H, ALA-GLY-ALA-GLY-ALA-ALA-ALA-ALA-ALA-ALA [Homo sapiens]